MIIKSGIKKGWILVLSIGLLWAGCDLYEDEKGDWDNDVTIRILNSSDCLVDLVVDGVSQESLENGEEFEEEDYGRGVHLLEAYPWNDAQFSCDELYTPDLQSGESFMWTITNDGDCGECDPTPTPEPATPTPSPTPES